MTRSVYQRVLGAAFAELDPVLQRYFGPVPAEHVGRGHGVYEIAGPRHPLLVPLFAPFAGSGVLFPERGRDVPFEIENRSDAAGRLRAVRRFVFPRRIRVMHDEMTADGAVIVDRLGRRGGLEVTLAAEVRDGAMRLTSTALALRVRALRCPLPRLARVVVTESGDRLRDAGQRVEVRVSVPLVGEVFSYRGAFSYRVEPLGPDVGGPP